MKEMDALAARYRGHSSSPWIQKDKVLILIIKDRGFEKSTKMSEVGNLPVEGSA